MAGLKIDLDDGILYEVTPERRPTGGVSIRKDPETGADVFMYKRKPGIYYSANGIEVSKTMAKRAGFDVDRLEKQRNKMLMMAEFETKYNAQLAGEVRHVVAERSG